MSILYEGDNDIQYAARRRGNEPLAEETACPIITEMECKLEVENVLKSNENLIAHANDLLDKLIEDEHLTQDTISEIRKGVTDLVNKMDIRIIKNNRLDYINKSIQSYVHTFLYQLHTKEIS